MINRVTLFERMIDPAAGGFSTELARYILSIDFLPAEHARYEELAAKSQDGPLSPEEREELEEFVSAGDILAILQAKARVSLLGQNSAA